MHKSPTFTWNKKKPQNEDGKLKADHLQERIQRNTLIPKRYSQQVINVL